MSKNNAEQHIETLYNQGALVGASYEPLTLDFYHEAVEQCRAGGFNAVTFALHLPDIADPMMIAFWRDGHVDSGSEKAVCRCLAR